MNCFLVFILGTALTLSVSCKSIIQGPGTELNTDPFKPAEIRQTRNGSYAPEWFIAAEQLTDFREEIRTEMDKQSPDQQRLYNLRTTAVEKMGGIQAIRELVGVGPASTPEGIDEALQETIRRLWTVNWEQDVNYCIQKLRENHFDSLQESYLIFIRLVHRLNIHNKMHFYDSSVTAIASTALRNFRTARDVVKQDFFRRSQTPTQSEIDMEVLRSAVWSNNARTNDGTIAAAKNSLKVWQQHNVSSVVKEIPDQENRGRRTLMISNPAINVSPSYYIRLVSIRAGTQLFSKTEQQEAARELARIIDHTYKKFLQLNPTFMEVSALLTMNVATRGSNAFPDSQYTFSEIIPQSQFLPLKTETRISMIEYLFDRCMTMQERLDLKVALGKLAIGVPADKIKDFETKSKNVLAQKMATKVSADDFQQFDLRVKTQLLVDWDIPRSFVDSAEAWVEIYNYAAVFLLRPRKFEQFFAATRRDFIGRSPTQGQIQSAVELLPNDSRLGEGLVNKGKKGEEPGPRPSLINKMCNLLAAALKLR